MCIPQRPILSNYGSIQANTRHMSQRVSIGGYSERGYLTNEKHYSPYNNSNVEDDAEGCIVSLGPSSGPESRKGQDKGWNREKEADEKCTTCEQGEDGEHEGAYCHSRVILPRRRHTSDGCFHRLPIHHNGVVSKLCLVIVVGLIWFVISWRCSLFKN